MTKQLSICLSALLILASCGSRKEAETSTSTLSDSLKYIPLPAPEKFLPNWSTSNTITYHISAEPDMLHPTNGSTSVRLEILQYTHMYLVRTNMRTLQPEAALLESFPKINPDGISYNCKLRADAQWDDGSPITASDVMFTAMASKCPLTENPQLKPYWSNIREIIPDPNDPRAFKVNCVRSYMYNILIWSDFPIIQKSFFDPENVLGGFTMKQFDDTSFRAEKYKALSEWSIQFNDADHGRKPSLLAGAGPYRVSSWEEGQSITLEKKLNHWARNSKSVYETAGPDKIIFKINKDPNSQILEFKSMAYDGSNSLATRTMLELMSDSIFMQNYHAKFTDSFNYSYIAMNNRPDGEKHQRLFEDRKVRRAMAMLTPLETMNRIVNNGKNKRMVGPVSIIRDEFDSSLKPVPNDVTEALRILKECGWKDSNGDHILDKTIDGKNIPFEFTLTYHINSPEWKDYAAIIAEAYTAAGMKVNLQPLDIAVMLTNARNHDYDMFLGSIGQSAAPEDFTQLWHSNSWLSNGSNYSGFGSKESDALVDSIQATTDMKKRIPLSHRFQKMVYDEQPVIFMFVGLRRNIIHKRFTNAEMYFERPGIILNNLKPGTPN